MGAETLCIPGAGGWGGYTSLSYSLKFGISDEFLFSKVDVARKPCDLCSLNINLTECAIFF